MLRILTITTLSIASLWAAKDNITLKNGDFITGSLVEINEDQSVLFNFKEASEPLKIDAKQISKINLDLENTNPKSHSERVFLSNGDEIPCDIKSIDADKISFSTSFAGDFTVPRNQITKINFDNKVESIVYAGPTEKDKWDTLDNWKINNDALYVNGRGTAAIKLDLPNNFILRYTLEWKGDSPKFKTHFGGRSNTTQEKIDRYYMDFNAAGFQMTRVTSRKFDPLGKYSQNMRDLKNNRVNIELRVDRQGNDILLFVDDEQVAKFSDDSGNPPIGSWLIFESNQGNSENLTIRNIKVIEWAGTALTKGKQKEVVQVDADVLRDDQNLRYTGTIEKIKTVGTKRFLVFNSKFSKNSLEVPFEKASVIFFKKDENTPKTPPANFVAELDGGGKISLGTTTLKDGKANTTHPILGKCSIARSAISSLTATK